MPRVARDKAKTWRLIEFAVSPEGQTILATSGRSMPSLMSLANANAFLQPDLAPRNSRIFLDGVSTLRDFPIIPYWVEIEETAGEEVERAFHGEVPLDTAIQKALDRSTPIFSRQ
jgi:ABC-type glycerol-3-phosphate transport system substrate-binding protein